MRELCAGCAELGYCVDAFRIGEAMESSAKDQHYESITESSLEPECPQNIRENNIRMIGFLTEPFSPPDEDSSI